MTLTIAISDYTAQVNKTLSVQALLESRCKIYTVKVTFGAGDNYATNGVAASLKQRGLKTYLAVLDAGNNAGVHVRYDKTNEKIVMYGSNGAAPAALIELANASTVTQSKVFEFLVIGV